MIPPTSTVAATQLTPADLVSKIRSQMIGSYNEKDGTDFTINDTSVGRNLRVTLTMNTGKDCRPFRRTFEPMFKNTGITFVVINGPVSTREKATPAPATGRRK